MDQRNKMKEEMKELKGLRKEIKKISKNFARGFWGKRY